MASYCKLPRDLSFDGDLSENWRRFKQNFDIFLEASKREEKKSEVKVALLLNIMGEEGIEVYNTFDLNDAEKNNIEKVVEAFQDYCAPKTNGVLESAKFMRRSQTDGETFDTFLKSLEKLSEKCNYGDMRDRMIRERFVFGIRDKRVQQSLLKIHDLDLQKALEICRAAEAAKTQTKTLEENNVQGSQQKKNNGVKRKNVKQETEQNFDCGRCTTSHCPKQCPAFGKKYKKCGAHNHFTIACRAEDPQSEEDETDEARSKGTFRYTVENFSKMTDSRLSPPCYIRNLPWKIKVMPRTIKTQEGRIERFLEFFLYCNSESESTSWSCYAVAELRLLSNKEGTEPFSRKIQHLFYSKANNWGYSKFITWQDVLEVEKGYIKDDSITLEVHVVADMPHELVG